MIKKINKFTINKLHDFTPNENPFLNDPVNMGTWQPEEMYVVKCNNCNTSYSLDGFRELEFVGIQEIPEEDSLEYRNCPCGSTISILANQDALEDPEKGKTNENSKIHGRQK